MIHYPGGTHIGGTAGDLAMFLERFMGMKRPRSNGERIEDTVSNPGINIGEIEAAASGLSEIWEDPEGAAPRGRLAIALGKLAEAYGAPGWTDPGGADPHSYEERAAAHLAGGFPSGATLAQPGVDRWTSLIERALASVQANRAYHPRVEAIYNLRPRELFRR